MRVLVVTTVLLIGSNIFMTLAWYGHLKWFDDKVWIVAVFAAWGIALFEYMLQVPANRVGFTKLSLPQLKVLRLPRRPRHLTEHAIRDNGHVCLTARPIRDPKPSGISFTPITTDPQP